MSLLSHHRRGGRRRGNALVEFTLVGIPLMFVLFSIFEAARGMWQYVTLCHATEETIRFAVVHGENCGAAPNACTTTVAQVVTRFGRAGGGLNPAKVQLQLRAGCLAGAIYNAGACASVKTGTLETLLNDSSAWPDFGAPGLESVEVIAQYPFETAFALLWPGVGGMRSAPSFPLEAVSREMVQF